MPEKRARTVKGLAVAGALATAVGVAAVLGNAAAAPAQDVTTTTVAPDGGEAPDTTVVPDDGTRERQPGDPGCERGGDRDRDGGTDDTTGEGSSTDV